jgi:hypothetical protein
MTQPWQVTSEQLAGLEESAKKRLAERIANFLRRSFRDAEYLPTADLAPAVQEACKRSSRYGLTTDRGIAFFVIAAWIFGEQFDIDSPEVNQVLGDMSRPEADKIDWLAAYSKRRFDELCER